VKRSVLALPLATALGVGYIPFASGTFGSAVGLVLWWLMPASSASQGALIVALFALGSWAAGVAERRFDRTDPSQVVIDEVLGMWITLFLNPVGWAGAVAAFLLFRIFDILKPYPADRFERLPGGVGVMADDAMAAVYANLVLRASLAIWNRVLS
jgi:phosphatidylglycerophosphatase A